jgi:glyoxylase-like metal-dependent hydrolase (beta-lactamase superfamily II)
MRCFRVALLLVLAAASGLCAGAPSPPQAVEVASGVFAFIGAPGDPDPDNEGRVGNGGFVVGPTGIAVIDAGASYRHGEALLAAIRRVSDRPIEAVIITHAVQEFLFGIAAFEETGATLITHARSAELMRARCQHCLENLRQMVGEGAMEGTRLVVPQQTVEGTTVLRVGGRELALIHPGWASTPGDLMVLDVATGTLFAGGLLAKDRIPELRDGRLDAWVAAIDGLRALPLRAIVPGHGPVITPEEARLTRDYLTALDTRMRTLYATNVGLMDAVDRAALPAFAGWQGYDTRHRRNALQRYLELEVEDLER